MPDTSKLPVAFPPCVSLPASFRIWTCWDAILTSKSTAGPAVIARFPNQAPTTPVTTAIAWPILFGLNRDVGPMATSTVTFLNPVFGSLWGALFLDESITLPMLAPTLGFVTLLTAVGYFQFFAEPYVMTQGGPAGSTRSGLWAKTSSRSSGSALNWSSTNCLNESMAMTFTTCRVAW